MKVSEKSKNFNKRFLKAVYLNLICVGIDAEEQDAKAVKL